MGENLDFYAALRATGRAFKNETYRTWKLDFLPARGLCALEKKYLKAYCKGTTQEFYQLLKSDPFSIVNILIMCVIVILGIAVYRGEASALWLILASVMSCLTVFVYLLYKSAFEIALSHGIIWLVSSKPQRVRTINVDAVLKTFKSFYYLTFLPPYFVYIASIQDFQVFNNVLTPTVNAYLSLGLLAVLLVYSAAMLQFIHRKNFIAK